MKKKTEDLIPSETEYDLGEITSVTGYMIINGRKVEIRIDTRKDLEWVIRTVE